jgi:hypothetical protein
MYPVAKPAPPHRYRTQYMWGLEPQVQIPSRYLPANVTHL